MAASNDDEEYTIEVAFEHERRQPIRGWGSEFPGFMLPTDRRGWLDKRGMPVAFHPGQTETEDEKNAWFDDWEISNSDDECDEEGWTYAADFPLIDSHGSGKCGVTDFVRRRRWRRLRKVNTSSEKLTSSVEALTVEEPQSNEGFPRGPHVKGVCCWSEPDATTFSLRGSTYISDKLKVRSQPAIMSLVHVDLFASATRVDRVCERPDAFLASQRDKGDNRFMLCVNFQAPPHHMAVYFAIPHEAAETWDLPSSRLWERFLVADDEYRNSRWKVIPSVVEGPWMIKKSVGQKPALLGSKLQHTYHKEETWFEIDCNIYSSTTATWLVELLKGYSTAFAIDIAFCIQGNEREELPERVLGALRMSRPNLSRARPVNWGDQ